MKRVIIIMLFLLSSIWAKEAKSIVDSVCYACHGDKMEQSCYGVSEIPNTLDKGYIREALMQYKNGSKSDYGMGNVMSEQLGGLSDEEIDALSEYIPTLR